MGEVLIISSFVAASRVGGYAQSLALTSLGHEARLAPTVVFGRHPGLGPPGGSSTPPEVFEGLLAGAAAAGAFDADAVLVGYIARPDQVEAAAAALERAKAGRRPPLILLDPILGDEDVGVYVAAGVEAAIRDRLLPLADRIAPNLFELSRLVEAGIARSPEEALDQARRLGRPSLVSSVPAGVGRVGVLAVEPEGAWLATHDRTPAAPRGVGDLLKALYLHGVLAGGPPPLRLARTVGALSQAIAHAVAAGTDLPMAGLAARLEGRPQDLLVGVVSPGEPA